MKNWSHTPAPLVSPRRGGKFDILERLAQFLDTGTVARMQNPKPTSTFNWAREKLYDDTIITDSYRNGQNVRSYFKQRLCAKFSFNSDFMDWMRDNKGKTLADACAAYREIAQRRNDPATPTNIRHHNQFNQYTGDFLADNPDLGMNDVRRIWALKRKRPSEDGRHIYEKSDLDLEG